ncbi:ferritin [Acetobacteroides hydrogenigenes]|uniref:Ferritin n=1 Tax=Acetobacteroides hydrogenigenes TaxID=979970 RepID=A0A4R2EGE6_9BACT|nr:ferritin [Acetobacteroides hydrogenigenes]TCN67623.1 ferritin [Acetobacteroides hydrogenigenes]
MINNKMLDALNDQINAEFWSAFLYLSMSADFESKGFEGFAHWFRVQYKEESEHALKIFDYINDRGGTVRLHAIKEVTQTWPTPLAAFEDVLTHELKVTSLIHNLMDIAVQEKDYATQNFLRWYIDEQVEEEKNATAIIEKLKRVGDGGGLVYIDKELKKR